MFAHSFLHRVRRKGLLKTIFALPETPVWFICDPLGCIFAIVTYFLIGYGVFAVATITILPDPSLLRLAMFAVFVVFAYLAMTSHIKAMLTHPGVVPQGATEDDVIREYCEMYDTDDELDIDEDGSEVRRYCQRCDAPKPVRAHHCRVCRRCIRKADHHCIWVNNCVGENNMKYFVLFNLYIFVIASLALVYNVMHVYTCGATEWHGKTCLYFSDVSTILIMLFLFLESVLFSLFCMMMGLSIVSSIRSDETYIDRYKREQAAAAAAASSSSSGAASTAAAAKKSQRRMTNFEAVFGKPRSWHWLSPLTISRACLYQQRKVRAHGI